MKEINLTGTLNSSTVQNVGTWNNTTTIDIEDRLEASLLKQIYRLKQTGDSVKYRHQHH